MRFSFTSWDCVYGHLPFYRAEHEKFQMYDGMDVEKLGNAGYYIAKVGSRSQVFDGLIVEENVTPALLRTNKSVYLRYMLIQRKELMFVPYSFSTPIVIYDRNSVNQDFYLTMGSLSGIDEQGAAKFAIQYKAVKTDSVMSIVDSRAVCDGFIEGNSNLMVYYTRVDRLEELLHALPPMLKKGEVPAIDHAIADQYYMEMFGYQDEQMFRRLAATYEAQCEKLIDYIGTMGW